MEELELLTITDSRSKKDERAVKEDLKQSAASRSRLRSVSYCRSMRRIYDAASCCCSLVCPSMAMI